MARVETLTPAQWADMRAYRDSVLASVRSPGPVDRGRVEAAVSACYAHIGEPAPVIVWVDGPTAVPMVGSMLSQVNGGYTASISRNVIRACEEAEGL